MTRRHSVFQVNVNKPFIRRSPLLAISGERTFEKEEQGEKYHRVERAYGSFVRSFSLPKDAYGSRVSAGFKDGIFRVHLSKSQKAKALEIKVG